MIKVFLNTAFQPHHRNLVTSLTNIRYISLLEQYEQRVATGAIVNDLEQRNVIFSLNELLRQISRWYNSLLSSSSNFTQKSTFFSPIIKRISSMWPFRRKIPPPKGVYIYGDVGLYALKQSNFQGDAIIKLSDSLVAESNILCLDEFQELFKHPFVLVTTSNRAPERLYENGLQRESFLPCIELIKAYCDVFSMNSGSDYRRSSKNAPSKTYYYPFNDSNRDNFESLFLDLIGTNPIEPQTLTIYGRKWVIPSTAGYTAKFSFSNVCEKSFGPADYVELAKRFRCIFISNIPKLTLTKKDEARRFISLIDALYDHKVVLFCLAECHFKDLFDFGSSASKSTGSSGKDTTASGTNEVLAFKRTISRFYEMNSPKWFVNLQPPIDTEIELKK